MTQPHHLVTQLRFARAEFKRLLVDVSPEDALVRLGPMNCLSWMIGHLANQEQFYWLIVAGQAPLVPGLNELVGFRKPASTPPLAEMWAAWEGITAASEAHLDSLTEEILREHVIFNGRPLRENSGTRLQRCLYHYWFHTGEAHAVRQQLGHTDLPQYVGDMLGFGAGY